MALTDSTAADTRRKAARIVTHVMAELKGRRGISQAFSEIDEDVMQDLLATLVDIVAARLVEPA